MSEELIQKLAAEIASRAILQNGYLYLIVIFLSLIGTIIGQFVMSYAHKRGETLATKADFQEIMTQIKESTAAIETIKTDIAFTSGQQAAIRGLYRERIEKMIEETFELDACINIAKGATIDGLNIVDAISAHVRPLARIETMQKLYFTKLSLEMMDLKFRTLMQAEALGELFLAIKQCKLEEKTITSVSMERLNQCYAEFWKAILVLQNRLLEQYLTKTGLEEA